MDKILVIGAGSIGALMGAALVKAGLTITFASKPNSNYTQVLQKQGLQLHYAHGEKLWISPLHPQVSFVDTATNLNQKFDVIIIALKSNRLTEVVAYIQAHSTPQTILIHAQNGIPYWWFNCDRYLACLDKNISHGISSNRYLDTVDSGGILYRTLSKYTSVGCVVKAPCQKNTEGKIEIRKPPQLILGLTKQEDGNQKQQTIIQHLCHLFSQHGLKASYTDKIRTAVCNKLAINLTTNVLSALTGKIIAELTAHAATKSLIETIITEVNYIFSCYGIDSEDLPTETKIYSYIQTPGSQSHLPSLAQDFSQGKLGEISLITAPVEMAQIARLQVPTLSILSELLQLAQIHILKSSNRKSYILSIDDSSGYCKLTKDVRDSSVVDEYQMQNLLSHLDKVNVSAVGK